jgi:hypothetical protein
MGDGLPADWNVLLRSLDAFKSRSGRVLRLQALSFGRTALNLHKLERTAKVFATDSLIDLSISVSAFRNIGHQDVPGYNPLWNLAGHFPKLERLKLEWSVYNRANTGYVVHGVITRDVLEKCKGTTWHLL